MKEEDSESTGEYSDNLCAVYVLCISTDDT